MFVFFAMAAEGNSANAEYNWGVNSFALSILIVYALVMARMARIASAGVTDGRSGGNTIDVPVSRPLLVSRSARQRLRSDGGVKALLPQAQVYNVFY